MKKLILISLPFLLVACFGKPSNPIVTPPEASTVSSEVIAEKAPEVEKPTTTSTKIPEKAIVTPKPTTEPTKTTNSDKDADAMTAELDRLIDEIVGG